jgi:hypothetical protein
MLTHTTYYQTTALEDWITNFYLNLNIHSPQDIIEDYIASELFFYIGKEWPLIK